MESYESNPNEKLWNKNLIFIILANCCSSMSFQILIPTLPLYLQQFGYTQTIVGLVVGILVFTTIIFRPYIGKMIDTRNRRNLFIMGMIIIMISTFLYQFTSLVIPLTMIRLLHGIGWGIVTTAANTMAIDFIPKKRMGEGLGYYGLSSVVSMAVAPAVGLYIIQWGFDVLFTVSTILVGVGILFVSLITYKWNFNNRSKEKTGRALSLFEKSALRPSILNYFISLTFSSITTFITLYAIDISVKNIGAFFMILSMTLFITRPITGRLVDSKGFNYIIIPGIFFIGIAIVILVLANSLSIFLVAGVLYGIGLGAIQPSLQTMVAYHAPPQRYGAANSTFLLSSDLGFGIGAMLWGKVANMTGYSTMYLFVLIPVLIALLFQIIVGQQKS